MKTITDTLNSFETWYGNLEWVGEGEMMVSGYGHDTTMNALLIKYNTQGDPVAVNKFQSIESPGDPFIIAYDWEKANSPDSSLYLFNWIGDANNSSNAELSVIKASKEGRVIWQKKYSSNLWDRAICCTKINDQIIFGALRQNINIVDQNYVSRDYLFAIDSAGQVLWQYQTPGSELRHGATALAPAGDGGLVVASGQGEEFYINPSRNGLRWHSGLIYKLNAQRQVEWEVGFKETFPTINLTRLNKLIKISDGSGYVAAGHLFMEYPDTVGKDINGWIVKVSEQGDSLWSRYLRFFTQSPNWMLMHFLYDLKETSDGGFILAGQADDIEGGWQGQQGWLVKVDQHGCLVPGCHETSPADVGPSAGPRLLLFPNPVGDYLNVFLKDPALPQRSGAAFRILDAQGRLLAAYPAGRLEEATSILPVQALTAGAYVLQYVDGQGVLWSGRFVKQ